MTPDPDSAAHASTPPPGSLRMREVGKTARQQISRLLGTPVYLDLRVKVLKEWQRDPRYLNRLGF